LFLSGIGLGAWGVYVVLSFGGFGMGPVANTPGAPATATALLHAMTPLTRGMFSAGAAAAALTFFVISHLTTRTGPTSPVHAFGERRPHLILSTLLSARPRAPALILALAALRQQTAIESATSGSSSTIWCCCSCLRRAIAF
jgi:cytochrome c biogenesis factor